MTVIVPDRGTDIISDERHAAYESLIEQEAYGRIEMVIRETREDIKWTTDVIAHGEHCKPGQYGQYKDIWSIPRNLISPENGLRGLWDRAWNLPPDNPDFDEMEEHRGESLIQIITQYRALLMSRLECVEEMMHQEKVRIFWDGDMENNIRQGGSGDCSFLAAVDSLKGNSLGRRAVTKSIRFNEETNQWYVKFQGDEQEREMPITQAHLDEIKHAGKAIEEGALGDQILERAYARLEDKRKRNVFHGEYEAVTVRVTDMAFEGGWAQNVFNDICGKEDIYAYRHSAMYAEDTFRAAEGRDAVFASSSLGPYELKELVLASKIQLKGSGNMEKIERWISKLEEGDTKHSEHIEYYIRDVNGRQHALHAAHAYSVKQFNSEEGWVELANPHDTSPSQRIRVSIETFQTMFKFLYEGRFINISLLSRDEFQVDHAIRLSAPPEHPQEPKLLNEDGSIPALHLPLPDLQEDPFEAEATGLRKLVDLLGSIIRR